jgi:hypothetical protein
LRIDGDDRLLPENHTTLCQMPIRQPHIISCLMTEEDVQLGEPEGEGIVLVDERHLHLVGQPLRKKGAQLQPTEPRPEDHHLALHRLSMLQMPRLAHAQGPI